MALEQELLTFNTMKEGLLKTHLGKFALIKGDQFVGAFDTPENAFKEGVDRFGKEQFLVKRISETEEIYRNYALAHGLINARL